MSDIAFLTDETYETEALGSELPALIDFYADWCGPCQMLSPTIEDCAAQYEGKVKFFKVNIDEQRKLAIANQVMSIPTLFFIKDGQVKERVTGALAPDELKEKIAALISS